MHLSGAHARLCTSLKPCDHDSPPRRAPTRLQAWSELDLGASGFIPAVELSSLLREVPAPLGVRGEADNAQAKLLFAVMSVDIPLRNNKVMRALPVRRTSC